MSSQNKLTKIVKKVEGDTELKYQPREIYSYWFADVIINNSFEVIDVRIEDVLTYGRDGEEIELDIEDMSALKDLIRKEAFEKAIESLEAQDFEDEEEQY